MIGIQRRQVRTAMIWTVPLLAVFSGCQQAWIDSADSIAQRIISQRQQETLGETSDFKPKPESGVYQTHQDTYAFAPHPTDPTVPEAFKVATAPPTTQPVTSRPMDDAGADAEPEVATQPADNPTEIAPAEAGDSLEQELAAQQSAFSLDAKPFYLRDALAFAFRSARDFQTQKEDLYLSALVLMTERQLWTPQVEAQVNAQYANYGQVRDFDQAMTAVSELSATQRLPYGGEVAARMINSLMRDIGRHTTSGESGSTILEANIPLLRGAGRVAFESRYQAERDLIYSVRDFEIARRELVVDVAGQFFDLLSIKTQIDSAVHATSNAFNDLQKAKALFATDRILQVEADRARVQYLDRSNDVITARIRYQAALDRFKLRIGMPTREAIDAVEEEMNLAEPAVAEVVAIDTALKYRLDLLNDLDRIEDARRQVMIAKNNFLPQFDFNGRVTMSTDPNQKNSMSYNTERTLWQAFLNLEVPIDRREERNVFRSSLIGLRRAERNYDLAQDSVRLDVRDALRNLEQARISMEIQHENIAINEKRAILARSLFERGKILSNRDVIEAENALQSSINQYAARLADFRLAILVLLRDTGTLRVDDGGMWR